MTTRLAQLLEDRPEPDWQIAAACGMHPSNLSRCKSGERNLTRRQAARLAELLGVEVLALYGQEE